MSGTCEYDELIEGHHRMSGHAGENGARPFPLKELASKKFSGPNRP
jgi:hypothetical protein